MTQRSEEVTRLLGSLRAGSTDARERLWEVVYEELRDLARARLQREARAPTLQPTMLVNEVYLRLVRSNPDDWESRAHFFGAAAEAMRRILIDRARAHASVKRREPGRKLLLDGIDVVAEESAGELLELDEALRELEEHNERQARVVELRFFAGLTAEDAARVLDVSRTTVVNDWRYARAWLQRTIDGRNGAR